MINETLIKESTLHKVSLKKKKKTVWRIKNELRHNGKLQNLISGDESVSQ